jgi:hypothetical protein
MHDQKFAPVDNFPKDYPWWKRVWSNITYWISLISLRKRKNALTKSDIDTLYRNIKKWDMLLLWNFQHASGFFIEWVVTHATAYVGKWRCIHAFAYGVNYISLRSIMRTYDTYILIRPLYAEGWVELFQRQIVLHIGKPYDFFFWADKKNETYFCTRLLNDTLQKIGYETGLKSIKESQNIIDQTLDATYALHRVLKPNEMLYGNFEVIAFSHNIIYTDNQYVFRDGIFWKIIIPK